MSDIDELEDEFSDERRASEVYEYVKEPGTPPPLPPPKPPASTTGSAAPIRSQISPSAVRRHRRSVSEQLFSVPNFHALSSRTNQQIRGWAGKRRTLPTEETVDETGSIGGGSLSNYTTGWDGSTVQPGVSAYHSDFSPFEREVSSETISNQQQQTPGSRQSGPGHFKQAFKRTVKKALNGKPVSMSFDIL